MFHRVPDITVLPGPTFFRMAWRIASYQGVMAIRAGEARREPGSDASPQRQAQRPAPRGVVTAGTVDPAFRKIFSFS